MKDTRTAETKAKTTEVIAEQKELDKIDLAQALCNVDKATLVERLLEATLKLAEIDRVSELELIVTCLAKCDLNGSDIVHIQQQAIKAYRKGN